MADFAVRHDGTTEGTMDWVMYIDPMFERLLLVDNDGKLYWKTFAECTVMYAHTPAQPSAVMLVQPQGEDQNKIVVPQLGLADAQPNRMTRRTRG